MGKIQNISKLAKNDFLFFFLILIFVAGLFVILSPKISSQLFSFKREAVLNEFIDSTKRNGKIDPQEYWKFREFYSPGYFTFSRDGIEKELISKTKEKIGISYKENGIDLTFLVFSSPRVNSLDMLTTLDNLNTIINESKLSKNDIIFANENCLIYKESPKIIKITFLLSVSDMKNANGFFDYNDKDKELVGVKNWYNTTTISR
jgi:hypothetical protein